MVDTEKNISITYRDLKEIINNVLDERDSLDRETHHMHHEAMQVWLENQKRQEEIIKQATNSAIGIIVLAFFAGLGWIGKIVLESIHLNGGQ